MNEYSVNFTSRSVNKPKADDDKEKRFTKNIKTLPCDSSAARVGTSERIFATRTTAVTQAFATYNRKVY